MTTPGRVLLLASGAAVVLGPIAIAVQISRLVPVDWLTWVPLALAAALSWLVLAR